MSDASTSDESEDVADKEAEAVERDTSAEQIKPDDRLTAPTTDDEPTSG